jgi:hypothetical protein
MVSRARAQGDALGFAVMAAMGDSAFGASLVSSLVSGERILCRLAELRDASREGVAIGFKLPD